MGAHETTLTGWRVAPFKETKLPDDRYRVEIGTGEAVKK